VGLAVAVQEYRSAWVAAELERETTDMGERWRLRGAALFEQHCVACHGPRPIGPPIEVLRGRTPEQLLVALVDPNREVDPRYETYLVELDDGRTLSGVLTAESASSIMLGLASGESTVVLRGQIAELRATGRSLMPEGFHRQLDADAVIALLAYLR
jgi:putative heme-binding domain-containing protein